LSDEDISNMQRPNLTTRKPTLLSFDFNSQERHPIESRSQANKELMKDYTVEGT
jgi:hypothetical protein